MVKVVSNEVAYKSKNKPELGESLLVYHKDIKRNMLNLIYPELLMQHYNIASCRVPDDITSLLEWSKEAIGVIKLDSDNEQVVSCVVDGT